MAELTISRLDLRYGAVQALKNISLSVADGEFVTLLGPSGCGKSTTLNAIAGLETPVGGQIALGGDVLFDGGQGVNLPPERRDCGVVFQSYALWPHMTVMENVAFPLIMRGVPKARRGERVMEALELVELANFADRYPGQLSGGQQQRVALARALVHRPRLLLLDEPLSNLDALLRDRARVWIRRIQKQLQLTTILVTHDQVEALSLSDRIAVMRAGEIVQFDTPARIYHKPSAPFVAEFLGSGFLTGEIVSQDRDQCAIRFADGQIGRALVSEPLEAGAPVVVAFKADRTVLAATPEAASAGETVLRVDVLEQIYLGDKVQHEVSLGSSQLKAFAAQSLPRGEAWIRVPENACVAFRAGAP